MLNAIEGVSRSTQNGLFINSCFAHCQTERQDTWFADDSPLIGNKVSLTQLWSIQFNKIYEILLFVALVTDKSLVFLVNPSGLDPRS